MTPVEVIRGDGPVILGLPHTGTYVPADIFARLNARGRGLDDTDWHIDRLYDGLLPGVTTVRATFHRYVIDANRDPAGGSLYPGQNTTGLVPLTDFDGHDIWDTPPTTFDIETLRATFHAPYHVAMAAEVARVQALHGVAIHYDCHSIRSRIPYLFVGTVPDLNIGTDNGASCDPRVAAMVQGICAQASGYGTILNGRFRGGWTTRAYSRPADGIHTIQMELAQSTYLTDEAAPWAYDDGKAERLRPHLARILHGLAALAPSLTPKGTT